MKANKERYLEIRKLVFGLLDGRSILEQSERKKIAQVIMNDMQCGYATALRHIDQALKINHGENPKQWGGKREGAGRPVEDFSVWDSFLE